MAVVLCLAAAGPEPSQERARFIVVLDPGHTPEKPGATSARGRPEREFNFQMAAAIETALADLPGVEAVWTNQRQESVSNRARAEMANRLPADLFISIHHDAVQAPLLSEWTLAGHTYKYCDRYQGYALFVTGKDSPAFAFAQTLGKRLQEQGFRPSDYHALDIPGERMILLDPGLGIYRHNLPLTVLTKTAMPAVLIEAGFIVNREEELELLDPKRQARMARAVRDAIADYREKR
jgi:N-acetylmuramoyl-L-alanine amidase